MALQALFELIINKMKEMEDTWPFHQPVSAKTVPDYHKVVKNPMDLQTMRENLRKSKYLSREDFLEHVSLIKANSVLYNGPTHDFTAAAERMLEVCRKSLVDKEEEILQLEKEINPMLSDDPQIAFSFILENLLVQLKTLPDSLPFQKPVSAKQVPDYYEVVKTPIDLLTIKQQVQIHAYQNREEFMEHMRMMYRNSVVYNGEHHDFSKMAERLVQFCDEALKENDDQLSKWENDILLTPGDDTSSYAASQPPSVAGPEWSAENSMEDFPEGLVKEEDSMMDMIESEELDTTGEEFNDFRAQLITPVSSLDQSTRIDADFDEEEDVDIEGYDDDESTSQSYTKKESFGSQQLLGSEQDSQEMSQFESILLDLQHSESESEEDDFPFGDGDDEDEEDIEEEEQISFSPGGDESNEAIKGELTEDL